jgi:hypothetical protein
MRLVEELSDNIQFEAFLCVCCWYNLLLIDHARACLNSKALCYLCLVLTICWFGGLVVWWFGGLVAWWFGGYRNVVMLLKNAVIWTLKHL